MAVTKESFPITSPSHFACGIDSGVFSNVANLSLFVAVLARSFQMCFSLFHMQAPCHQRITLLKPALLVIEAAWCMVGDRRKL
jgi:hypothetical protein